MKVKGHVITLYDDGLCMDYAGKDGRYDQILAQAHAALMQGKKNGVVYDFSQIKDGFVLYVYFYGNAKKEDNGWIRLQGVNFTPEQSRMIEEKLREGLDFKEIYSFAEDISRN